MSGFSRTYGTTHRTLPTTPVAIKQWPVVVEPMTELEAAPRRNRNHVCPHLRIGNEPVTTPVRFANRDPKGTHITDAYCTVRRSELVGEFVAEICTCSLARKCVFLDNAVTASTPKAVRVKMALANMAPKTCKKCHQKKGMDKFPRYTQTNGKYSFGARCTDCYTGPRKVKVDPVRDHKIIAAYHAGFDGVTIARQLGVSKAYVYKFLKEHNVERQSAA